MGASSSKEEQPPNEGWLIVDGQGDKFVLSEQEDPEPAIPTEDLPSSSSRPALRRPCDQVWFTPLPSIVEESLSSVPPSPPHTHTRSPSGDSQPLLTDSSSPSSLNSPPRDLSCTTSLESPLRDQSRTASLDPRDQSRTASLNSRSRERSLEGAVDNSVGSGRSLDLRSDLESFRYPSSPNSDCGSGRLPSEGFQLDSTVSSSTFQGSPVEGVLFVTRRVLRDDGFLAAVRYLQGYIDKDVDQEVSRALLHEACAQSTDEFTFNIVLMNSKVTAHHQSESLGRYTPLHVACSYLPLTVTDRNRWLEDQQKTKIRKLLSLNCDCTLFDKDGNTPLHLATFHNNADCVQLILQSSPGCIDIANNLGNTALHIASREGLVGVVCVLLEHSPKAGLPNRTKKQRCPLHQAIVKGHPKIVERLLSHDPTLVECVDGKRMQPLHLALKHHSPVIALRLLSQQHCPVTSTDVDDRTPLHYASEWGHLELVGLLLKRVSSGGYLNAADCEGDTALHLASRCGNQDVVALLKSKKASKKITNKAGETAKQAGINGGHLAPSSKKSLKRLFKRRRGDNFPTISSTDSLLSSTSSTQTTPLSREPSNIN